MWRFFAVFWNEHERIIYLRYWCCIACTATLSTRLAFLRLRSVSSSPWQTNEPVQGHQAAGGRHLWVSVESSEQADWRDSKNYANTLLVCLQGLIDTFTLCCQTAIKKMKKKFYSWDECIQLREVKVQQQLTTACVLVHSWSLLIVSKFVSYW